MSISKNPAHEAPSDLSIPQILSWADEWLAAHPSQNVHENRTREPRPEISIPQILSWADDWFSAHALHSVQNVHGSTPPTVGSEAMPESNDTSATYSYEAWSYADYIVEPVISCPNNFTYDPGPAVRETDLEPEAIIVEKKPGRE